MKPITYFVDFFDTIMLRHIHPFSVIERWALNICRKYGLEMSVNEIIEARNECFSNIRKNREEVVYDDAIGLLYEKLSSVENGLRNKCNQNDFITYAHDMEVALEVGVQYPNRRLIHFLRKQKEKDARIYIVSDFYFGAEEVKFFCIAKGIDISLFDGIFVSADCNATKLNGNLYQFALKNANVNPVFAYMLGDNPISDGKMAKRQGLRLKLNRRLLYKINLRFKRLLKYDYSKHVSKVVTSYCYRNGMPYSEYIAVFFSFTERLKSQLAMQDKVVFLAREGLFLKRLFELYDNIRTPVGKESQTAYFLCSRRAITTTQIEKIHKFADGRIDLYHYLISAGFVDEEIQRILEVYGFSRERIVDDGVQAVLENDIERKVERNRNALRLYADTILDSARADSQIHFVDIGWYGSMQAGLEKLLGIKTTGYYLGTKGDDDNPSKKGLIFSEDVAVKRQTYYDILKTNIQLYEQLSAASHGSAQAYVLQNGKIEIPLRWEDNERKLYYSVLQTWQENAVQLFLALAAWAPEHALMFTDRQNAETVLRSALFANRERRDFIRKLDEGFVWNLGQDTAGTKYDKKNVHIRFSIFIKPELYVRYAAKIQRHLPDNPVVQFAYMFFAHLFSLYVKLILKIKGAR